MPKPIVALVGRPNVGKSTLFNRLVGERRAIVEDLPGTTRDRLYGDLDWNGVEFTVVDTGGLVLIERPDDLLAQMVAQAQLALDEADVIVFLVDTVEGLQPGDEDVANMLRRTAKPVILVANKADNPTLRLHATEFYSLGLGDPYPVSAIHGTGSGDLLDKIVEAFPAQEIEEEEEALHIAIVGRPNVGKSSLLNAVIGQERAIVSPIPGTTRDPVDTRLVWDGQPVVIIDTAGIRRPGKIDPGIEKYSVLRTLRAVSRCDVALLLLDASEGLLAQDTHIAGYIQEEKKGILIVVNKWDAVEKDTYTTQTYMEEIRRRLDFIPWAPVLFVSALTHRRVDKVLPEAFKVLAARRQRVNTSQLNELVRDIMAIHNPPTHRGQKLKIYYASQPGIEPPQFVFFVNDATAVHFSYKRFIENNIRERFGFEGTSIELTFRSHRDN